MKSEKKTNFPIFSFNFFNMLHIICLFSERKQRLKRHRCKFCPWGPGTSSALNKHVKRNHGKPCPGGTGSPGPLQNDCPSDHETPGPSTLHVVARDGGGKRFVGDLTLAMEQNSRPLSPLVSNGLNFVSSQAEEASESESGTPSEPDHSSVPSDSD